MEALRTPENIPPTARKPVILVADPDERVRKLLQYHFRRAGNLVQGVATGEQALQAVRQAGPVDLVLLDMRLPGMSPMEALRSLNQSSRVGSVILMGLDFTVAEATAAMREGAYELVKKSDSFDDVHLAVRNALQALGLRRQVEQLKEQVKEQEQTFDRVIGRSAAITQVLKLAAKVRDSDITVLLTGESGVGKEVIARAMHSHGRHRRGPFVAINCAAIPESLLESELFGHEKGAFTGASERRAGKFAAAQDGTLFLDEVGELPLPLQAKLLRVLQSREVQPIGGHPIHVDVRIAAASNQDLDVAVQQGRFRLDLYYRLAVFPIVVPPLRERREDIAPLARHFVASFAAQEKRGPLKLHEDVLERMLRHPWDGNVRELENMIYRAVVLAEGSTLMLQDFPVLALAGHPEAQQALGSWTPAPGESGAAAAEFRAPRTRQPVQSAARLPGFAPAAAAAAGPAQLVVPLEEIERQAILLALEVNGGNISRAAVQLQVGRATLYRKFKKFHLQGR